MHQNSKKKKNIFGKYLLSTLSFKFGHVRSGISEKFVTCTTAPPPGWWSWCFGFSSGKLSCCPSSYTWLVSPTKVDRTNCSRYLKHTPSYVKTRVESGLKPPPYVIWILLGKIELWFSGVCDFCQSIFNPDRTKIGFWAVVWTRPYASLSFCVITARCNSTCIYWNGCLFENHWQLSYCSQQRRRFDVKMSTIKLLKDLLLCHFW